MGAAAAAFAGWLNRRYQVPNAECRRNESVVDALFESLSGKAPDFDRVRSLFAENAVYWALTPVSAPLHGPQAIVEDLKRQLSLAGDLKSGLPHALVSSNNYVVLERTDYVTVVHNQRRAGVRICAVFEFDENGLIAAWREYWDKAFCAQEMGFTA